METQQAAEKGNEQEDKLKLTGNPMYSALNMSAYPPQAKQKGFVFATLPVRSWTGREAVI